jgi:hypothetical protein
MSKYSNPTPELMRKQFDLVNKPVYNHQAEKVTFIYTTNEPPIKYTNVLLNVDLKKEVF